MTAVNVTTAPGRIDLYTDSAGLGFDGRVRRLVSKVRELPDMRCAIAVRGDVRALNAIAELLPTVGRDYDELYAAAKDGRLKAVLGWRAVAGGQLALLAPFDLVVSGWSSRGLRAFFLTSQRRMRFSDKAGGPRPWAPFKLRRALIMPSVALNRAMNDDPGKHMLEIMSRQRAHREPTLFIPKGRPMVGGFIEHTAVTANGISTRRFPGWPADQVGEPIGGWSGHRRAWARLALISGAMGLVVFGSVILGEAAWLVLARG